MTRRERVHHAMHYQPVDKVPLEYYYTPVGYYEHGDRLNDLFSRHPGDFEPYTRQPIPQISPSDFDADGNYYNIRTDEWGVTWTHRYFGIAGIPSHHPIQSPEDMARYVFPTPASTAGTAFAEYTTWIRQKQAADYFAFSGVGRIHELLLALYGDENVLCDIEMDEPEIGELADRIVEHRLAEVERAILAGADAITLGDDFGTQFTMVMSPETWRRFYKPRYDRLLRPAREARMDIHFHSCGMVSPILEDLRELGVTSIWPQLPAYNMAELATRCRELGLAVAIHTDRAHTMTYGSPAEVRELVLREFETFRMLDGGAWFYVEADNGFPYANIEALLETIDTWR